MVGCRSSVAGRPVVVPVSRLSTDKIFGWHQPNATLHETTGSPRRRRTFAVGEEGLTPLSNLKAEEASAAVLVKSIIYA